MVLCQNFASTPDPPHFLNPNSAQKPNHVLRFSPIPRNKTTSSPCCSIMWQTSFNYHGSWSGVGSFSFGPRTGSAVPISLHHPLALHERFTPKKRPNTPVPAAPNTGPSSQYQKSQSTQPATQQPHRAKPHPHHPSTYRTQHPSSSPSS